MPIEIEKKYRLTITQRDEVRRRLLEIGAERRSEECEENTIYTGVGLEVGSKVLRLRRVGDSAILTFKQRLPSTSPIKQQLEEETVVADAEAMNAILQAVGFTPALVYEKRRETWILNQAEIVIDELPFGLFMEIEAEESKIVSVEDAIAGASLEAEYATYPQLTKLHGKRNGKVVEARFEKSQVDKRKA